MTGRRKDKPAANNGSERSIAAKLGKRNRALVESSNDGGSKTDPTIVGSPLGETSGKLVDLSVLDDLLPAGGSDAVDDRRPISLKVTDALSLEHGTPITEGIGLTRRPASRRGFLIGFASGALVSAGGILFRWGLEESSLETTIKRLYRRAWPYVPGSAVPPELEWLAVTNELKSYSRDRAFDKIDAFQTEYPIVEMYKRLTTHTLRGEIGRAFIELESSEYPNWLNKSPDYVAFDAEQLAARAYSISGNPIESIKCYKNIRNTSRYNSLLKSNKREDNMQVAQLMRDEINHTLQLSNSSDQYFGRSGQILSQAEDILKQAILAVGSTLDIATAVDQTTGPAVHVMKEHIGWIKAWSKQDYVSAENHLTSQLSAIRRLRDGNWRIANMRYTPLASQLIISGNSIGALELLDEQATEWSTKGEFLEGNHKLEYSIHLLMRARAYIYLRKPLLALPLIEKANTLLRGANLTLRFGHVIEKYLAKAKDMAGDETRVVNIHNGNAARLPKQGGDFYFFGV